jgi:hypothetical protein
MSVDLGGLEAGVPEQFLNDPQVGTAIEQVGGEAVPQGVRVRRNRRSTVQKPPDITGTKSPACSIQEYRLRRGLGADKVDPAALHPLADRLGAELVHGNTALPTPLAPHRDHPAFDVYIAGVQPAQLGHPEPRAVEELEHGIVSESGGGTGDSGS